MPCEMRYHDHGGPWNMPCEMRYHDYEFTELNMVSAEISGLFFAMPVDQRQRDSMYGWVCEHACMRPSVTLGVQTITQKLFALSTSILAHRLISHSKRHVLISMQLPWSSWSVKCNKIIGCFWPMILISMKLAIPNLRSGLTMAEDRSDSVLEKHLKFQGQLNAKRSLVLHPLSWAPCTRVHLHVLW